MSGIWVRSQDKRGLYDCSRIFLTKGSRDNSGKYKTRIINQVLYQSDVGDYGVLGEYTTEERALQVLDMIQRAIINGTTEAHEGDTGTWRRVEKYGAVFEMPAE